MADGTWWVTDDKTGSVWTNSNDDLREDVRLQLELYALAVEGLTGERAVPRVRFGAGDAGAPGSEEQSHEDTMAIPWDEERRRSVRALLGETLADLREGDVRAAEDLASPGKHCRACLHRPYCATYLREAPMLWTEKQTAGRMPLDTWGQVSDVEERGGAFWLSLKDPARRLVRVGRIDSRHGVQHLRVNDRAYLFGLAPDENRQNAERYQFTNLRELPSPGSARARRAYGLRVFRGVET